MVQGLEGERERQWRAWVDEKFVKVRNGHNWHSQFLFVTCVMQVLTVNIYRNMSECFATMDYLSTIRCSPPNLKA